jgi:glutamate-ammonia-ligase adenylyltransferase
MSYAGRRRDPLSGAVLARFGFADLDKAARLLGEPGMVAVAGSATALADFQVAADPDLALLTLSRLVDLGEPTAGLERAFVTDAAFRCRFLRIVGLSEAFGGVLLRHPRWWTALAGAAGGTGSGHPSLAMRTALLTAVGADPEAGVPVASTDDDSALLAMRKEYRRQLLVIADQDLSGGHAVDLTTELLSDLADAVLEASLAIARADVAEQQTCRLAIVAMGKCGARELNYLSDVDVIFVAEPVLGADEQTAVAAGTALAKRLMNITMAHTEEGTIWEVDAGLRPEGKAGALVRTLASHLDYYRRWAKTWEFQALLKARAAAGDRVLGNEFVSETRPLVWNASRRPDFVSDVQSMRRRVERSIPARHADRELKLGTGGLRDIEFAVQLLQMVHGSSDITVRSPTTLIALEQLATWGYIGRDDGRALGEAYRFLRTLEHRLQLRSLRRTHTLPDDPAELRWLGRSMGFRRDPAEELMADWRAQARTVRRLHEKLFYRPLLNAVVRLEPGQARLTAQAAEDRLTMLGYVDPAGALRHLEALSAGVSRRAAIQRTLLPVMLGWFADGPDPDAGLLGFRSVSDTLGTTPWYLRLLRDESAAAQRLATVLSSSRYASELLLRAPEGVGILADAQSMVPLDRESLLSEMRTIAARHEDLRTAVAGIRAVRRRELFRISAADVCGLLTVQEAGWALSDLADATIDAALFAGVSDFERRTQGPVPARLVVVAMGRLGGRDLSYASDADVVYVHSPIEGESEAASGAAALEIINSVSRELAVPSPDPPLGLDADLRPEGRQGPLVRSIEGFRAYYRRFSAPWEAQALLRARPIAGDAHLAIEYTELVDPVRYPTGGLTPADLRQMRRLKARMEAERLPRGADPRRNTKLGPGGLSDVEWVVQMCQQQSAHDHQGLRTTATMEALAVLRTDGLIAAEDADRLSQAWCLAARVRNAVTLVAGKGGDQIPVDLRSLAGVAHILGYPAGDSGAVVEDYLRVTRHARAVFERIFFGDD